MMKNYDKIYDNWNEVKKNLSKIKHVPDFQEGQIWWVGIGMNLGSEVFGKDHDFARPMLIIKKNYNNSFVGLPLTTKLHNGTWYEPLIFKGREQRIILNQVKNTSVLRLYRRMGEVSDADFERITLALVNYLAKKYLPEPRQRESRVTPKIRIKHIYTDIISHLSKKVKKNPKKKSSKKVQKNP